MSAVASEISHKDNNLQFVLRDMLDCLQEDSVLEHLYKNNVGGLNVWTSNIAVERLASLLPVLQIPGTSLDRGTGYPDSRFLLFFLLPSRNSGLLTLNRPWRLPSTPFPISHLNCHPAIVSYVIYGVEEAQSNDWILLIKIGSDFEQNTCAYGTFVVTTSS
jgi:hypothetical protein